jgi:hypothetical protein
MDATGKYIPEADQLRRQGSQFYHETAKARIKNGDRWLSPQMRAARAAYCV